ncbi:MAG TPA: VWA domain-containing protein [Anaerolineae bacterium]|nr:VWA domain-containing protein [Anaerolineae bacterium]
MLNLDAITSRHYLGITTNQQLLYFLITATPPPQYTSQRLPLNIAFVIDRSTSMKGPRLERVKAAAKILIDNLAPEDTISIISFSDRAETVIPATSVKERLQMFTQLQGIEASGGTEIYQGLLAALHELRKKPPGQALNHLILLTDGHTYGDADQCLEIAEQAAARGIGISAFGLGAEWNDHFLDLLVAPSGGQSDFIASPEQIMTHLQKRLQGLGSVYAHNLRLQPKLPPGISIREIFKVAPFAQPLNKSKSDIPLGNMEGVSPISLLLEIGVEPQFTPKNIDISFSLVADIPSHSLIDFVTNHRQPITVQEEPPTEHPPDAIIEAVRILQMYRMHEQVWTEMDEGRVQSATQRMNRLTSRLAEAGYEDLAAQAQLETRRLMKMGTMSLEGRKKLKYGTRSLMTKSLALKTNILTDNEGQK